MKLLSLSCMVAALSFAAPSVAMATGHSGSPFDNYAQGYDDGIPIIHIPYARNGPEDSFFNIPGVSVHIIYNYHSDMVMYQVKQDDQEVTMTTNTNGSRCRTLHGTSGETLFEACFE